MPHPFDFSYIYMPTWMGVYFITSSSESICICNNYMFSAGVLHSKQYVTPMAKITKQNKKRRRTNQRHRGPSKNLQPVPYQRLLTTLRGRKVGSLIIAYFMRVGWVMLVFFVIHIICTAWTACAGLSETQEGKKKEAKVTRKEHVLNLTPGGCLLRSYGCRWWCRVLLGVS